LRPLPEGEAGTYELVAGARRFRASKLAKRDTIPATVRELTDAQALELQVIENVQRVDVHPLDEAQGYAALIGLQPETYTVESIASRVGRSPAYLNARLRLIQLIPEAKQAFYEDKLTVAHAFEIARLQPNDQRRALQECFPQYRNAVAILKDKKAEAATVRELRAWIEREIHLDLTNAPFNPQDETLLPNDGEVAAVDDFGCNVDAVLRRSKQESRGNPCVSYKSDSQKTLYSLFVGAGDGRSRWSTSSLPTSRSGTKRRTIPYHRHRHDWHRQRRKARLLLKLRRLARGLQLLLLRRNLGIDLRIFRQGNESLGGGALRHVPLHLRPVLSYFTVLVFDLLVEGVQGRGKGHALRADNNAVKTAAVSCIDRITRINVLAYIGAVEDGDIRESGGPCAIAKPDRPRRGQELDLGRVRASERRAAQHQPRRVREQRAEDSAEGRFAARVFRKNQNESPERHVAQGGAILKPADVLDRNYPLQHTLLIRDAGQFRRRRCIGSALTQLLLAVACGLGPETNRPAHFVRPDVTLYGKTKIAIEGHET